MLRADAIAVEIDSHRAVSAASLTIAAGELVGLIGPNGAGKSTLLKALCGLLPTAAGTLSYRDQPLEALSASERGRQFGYLSQGARAQWPVTVETAVGLGRLPYQGVLSKASAADQAAVEAALTLTQTADKRTRLATQLSGGEQTLVMLARVFAGQPQLIFADEPVAALDPYHQLHVMELLRQHATGDRAGLVVLHDLELAARFCDRLYLCHRGQLVASGSPREVLTAANLASVYGVVGDIHEGSDGLQIHLRQRLPR